MSLTRRLRRLLRAHFGFLRADPMSDRMGGSRGPEVHVDTENPASVDASHPDVPPDVATAYRALEIPVGSDRETVKEAYRHLMKKYHQDHFRDDDEKHEIAGTVSTRLNRAHDRIIEYLDPPSS